MTEPIVGHGFGPVADAFKRTIGDAGGASLSIWVDGEPVVELAGGEAAAGVPFTTDTLSMVYSCTKGVASLLVAKLIGEGRLPGYETPIREVWQEFDACGKGDVSIGDVLAHRAGVFAPRRPLTRREILDPLAMADVLAEQEPLWRPGESHQYHTAVHGALTAKLVHIATGETIGNVFRREITDPLDADLWIGLPKQYDDRVATLLNDPAPLGPEPIEGTPEFWLQRATDLGGALDFDAIGTDLEVRRSELPGVNGIGTADGLARIWSVAVTPTRGVQLVSPEMLRQLADLRSGGPAFVWAPPPRQAWGAGVMVPSDWQWYLTPWSVGHDGAGGQVAFGDPTARLGFGYITNRLRPDGDAANSIIAALANVLH